MSENNSVGCSFGLGSIIAAIISSALNHSFWWGLLHFFLSGFYILYAVLFRTREIVPALKEMFGI